MFFLYFYTNHLYFELLFQEKMDAEDPNGQTYVRETFFFK